MRPTPVLLVPSGLQCHGRDLLLSAAKTICVIVDSKEVVGRRRRRRAGVHRHRPSPTRPEEPSLALVGSGMAAGAAFGQRRVRDVGAVRSFLPIGWLSNVNAPPTHATRGGLGPGIFLSR